MALEWMIAAIVIAVLTPLFGHFEAKVHVWRRVARWLAYLAVLFILEQTVGRPWTLLWLIGLPAIGAIVHFTWCFKNQINPLTAEPRDRYYRLRGWQ